MIDIKSTDHPEARGRKPLYGEQEYKFYFISETGEQVIIRMGKKGWDNHSQHVLDMLSEAPSYTDEQ